jgi:hypothetical protein
LVVGRIGTRLLFKERRDKLFCNFFAISTSLDLGDPVYCRLVDVSGIVYFKASP